MATTQMNEVIQHLRRTALLQDGAGLTDGQLLADYVSGRDEAALAALVWRHGPMVWGVCRRVLRNHHDAEDAFQATFLVLVRKAASLASPELLANWLYGVAHQTALKARATAARRKERERQVTEMTEPAAAEPDLWTDLQPGVLKTMAMTKLKIATAVLFLASTVAVTCGVLAGQQQPGLQKDVTVKAQIKPAEPPKEDKEKLQGTWRMVSGETDGLMFGEGRPENKDTRLVFEKSSFTLFGKLRHSPDVPLEPEDVKYTSAFTLDIKKNPKVIVLAWKESPWNGKFKNDFTHKAIYGLEGDTLRLCMSLPYADKELVPTELSANAGSKRSLWTFKRDPPSAKGGEKQHEPVLLDNVKAKAQINPAEVLKKDKDQLQGTWRMVTAEMDGFRNGEGRPELKDNRLVIEQSSFTLAYAVNVTLNGNTLELQKAETTTSAGTFTLDTKQTPKVIVLTWKESPVNEKKDFTQYAIYTLDGDSLRLCLNGADDPKKSPTEFSANAGSKRVLWTFKREPATAKGGEKKP